MSRRGRAIHRADATAKDLIAAAKKFGAQYMPQDGTVDGILYHKGELYLVDFKSKGATLTDGQAKLVAAGWPIKFVSTVEQLVEILNG